MENENRKELNWFKQHVDTVMVLSAILGSMIWVNGKFNELERDVCNH